MTKYNWHYDERKQSGVDYLSEEQAKSYDTNMLKFRDYKAEAEYLAGLLRITRNDSIIDLGCGTGAQSIGLSQYCGKVQAVDISDKMLAVARGKAENRGIHNIKFIQAGFLTYEHEGAPADFVISGNALHHLPDFWKMVAFTRIYKMLKEGGTFFLTDVIFQFPVEKHAGVFDAFLENFEKNDNEAFAKEGAIHISEEYSTFDWVIEGMLERAGFRIERKLPSGELMAAYICKK